jgi:hypothetical protein
MILSSEELLSKKVEQNYTVTVNEPFLSTKNRHSWSRFSRED